MVVVTDLPDSLVVIAVVYRGSPDPMLLMALTVITYSEDGTKNRNHKCNMMNLDLSLSLSLCFSLSFLAPILSLSLSPSPSLCFFFSLSLSLPLSLSLSLSLLTQVLYGIHLGIWPQGFEGRVWDAFPPPQDVAPHHNLPGGGGGGPGDADGRGVGGDRQTPGGSWYL